MGFNICRKTKQERNEKEEKSLKKTLPLMVGVILVLLTLLVDIIVVETAGGLSALSDQIEAETGFLLLILNFLIVGTALYGGRLYRQLEKKGSRLLKVLDWAALLLLPPLLFLLVQWLIGDGFEVETIYLTSNLLIYYWIYLLFLLLFSRAAVSCFSYSLLMLVLALVEYFVYQFRYQPFTLLDVLNVRTAMSVAGGYSYEIGPEQALPILLFLFVLAFQVRMQKLTFGKRSVKNVCVRFGCMLALICAAYFGRSFYLDSENCYLWSLNEDYTEKGYVYTLAKEIRYLKIEVPEGYSAAGVETIAEELSESKETQEETAEAETVIPENLIVIMNESFTDFTEVGEIAADEDVLANFHALQEEENVKSGQLSVQIFGGGTCQTEYEVLTGNSVTFQPVGSIAYQLYTEEPEYGMAASLKAQGYRTVAVHPNSSLNWNRKKVYANMEFDKFINIRNWKMDYEMIGSKGKITDESTYDKLIHICENKKTDQKMFLFCVTMQNHAGYDENGVGEDFEPTVELSYDADYPLAENYLSLLKKSDEAFAELIDYFRDVDEPTMIVMFGDHWPSLEEDFYTQLFSSGSGAADETAQLQQRFQTPYVIWTNYPSESGTEDMSANYFGAYLTRAAGLELTPYQEFLLEMKEEIPVIASGMVKTADGEWISTDALTGDAAEWMSKYQILEYNNVFDRKNRLDEIFSLG